LKLSNSAEELFEEAIRDFLEIEVGRFCDRRNKGFTLESERVKIIKAFIKMIKDKNTP
jgi:hypothetical protein